MKQMDSLIAGLKTLYNQQGQTGKFIIAGIALVVLCCLCSIPLGIFPSRNSSNVLPTAYPLPSTGITATPTPLYGYDLATFTPFPTFPSSTSPPTLTRPPTETATATQAIPTSTIIIIPTS